MSDQKTAEALLYTNRGKTWLNQFAPEDQEIARKIVTSLTLVSHSAFERALQSTIEREALDREGPHAFYAVRQVQQSGTYFEQYADPVTGEINALISGSDHGSEARVAALIRNFCKTDPDRLLNHPTLDQMRSKRCRTVFLIDDFIGSGERTEQFLDSLWRHPTFRSWHSLKYIHVTALSYSGTARGIKRVEKHTVRPKVIIQRSCPTFKQMPWGKPLRASVLDVCERYGAKTSEGYWWDGFDGTMAALVFEHGCPDNAPAILWAPDEPSKPWLPLFPDRAILAGEQSAFPPEIARGDLLVTLLDAGQKNLAMAGQLSRRGQMGETILLVLALIAKGQRKQSTLSFATGLDQAACAEVIDRCIKWGFLTPARQLTPRGHAEIKAAKKLGKLNVGAPDRGEDYYFPKQLRRTTRG